MGNSAEFAIGAGYTIGMPGPFKGVGRVCSLHDGSFIAEGPAKRGVPGSMGLSAVIKFGTIDILVTEECSINAHGWFSYEVSVVPNMENNIQVMLGSSRTELDICITVDNQKYIIHSKDNTIQEYSILYKENQGKSCVRIKFDKISYHTPYVFWIKVLK